MVFIMLQISTFLVAVWMCLVTWYCLALVTADCLASKKHHSEYRYSTVYLVCTESRSYFSHFSSLSLLFRLFAREVFGTWYATVFCRNSFPCITDVCSVRCGILATLIDIKWSIFCNLTSSCGAVTSGFYAGGTCRVHGDYWDSGWSSVEV